jgi:predicted transcriptional regulator
MSEPSVPVAPTGETIASARRDLGRLLKGFRHRAELSQRHLALRIGYSHSVVAWAETGRAGVSAQFWQRADELLETGGQLVTGDKQVRYLERWAREQTSETVILPRSALTGREQTITTPSIGVCPNCRQPLEMIAQLATPATDPS